MLRCIFLSSNIPNSATNLQQIRERDYKTLIINLIKFNVPLFPGLKPLVYINLKNGGQGGSGHWYVNYTSIQS